MNTQDLLNKIRTDFREDKAHWSDVYRKCHDEMMFLWDCERQWDDWIANDRTAINKPNIVMNELFTAKQAIVNRQRINKIAIKVDIGNDEADEDTAEFLQDSMRAVEHKSKAYIAYEWAFDNIVSGGIGWCRILTKYENNNSFEQEPYIERILNPFSVIPDRHSVKHDFSDMKHCCIYSKIKKDEYRKLKSKVITDYFDIINESSDFQDEEYCTIIEYFYKDSTTRTLLLLDNGEIVFKDEVSPEILSSLTIIKERDVDEETIKWIKTDGYTIFDRTEWVGKHIPMIPMIGNEVYMDGKRWFHGIVHNSKDAQILLNYWVSTVTEMMSKHNHTQFLAAAGQCQGDEWKDGNINRRGVLTYNPSITDDTGRPLPPPQIITHEPAIQAAMQQVEMFSAFIKSTDGVQNAALGAPSNESSGRAIDKRNAQTEITNYNYANNLESSIEYCGTVLVDLICNLWDTPTKKRVMLESGEHKIVPINQPFKEKGKTKQINLKKGNYAVTVTAGASYANKRQEQAAMLLGLMNVSPIVQSNPLVAYHYAKDIGANEAAEAIMKTLPPELKEHEDEENYIAPEVKQKMQKDAQTIEMLTQALNEAQDKIDNKILELESKERIAAENNKTKLTLELMKEEGQDDRLLFTQALQEINSRLSLLQANQPVTQGGQEANVGQNIPQEQPAIDSNQLDATNGDSLG